jgi:hypothetical protein
MKDIKVINNIYHFKKLELQKSNSYYYTFSVLETLILFGISVWQFYYMKQLHENKATI